MNYWRRSPGLISNLYTKVNEVRGKNVAPVVQLKVIAGQPLASLFLPSSEDNLLTDGPPALAVTEDEERPGVGEGEVGQPPDKPSVRDHVGGDTPQTVVLSRHQPRQAPSLSLCKDDIISRLLYPYFHPADMSASPPPSPAGLCGGR